MTTEPKNQPEHVRTEDLNAGMARMRQGLEEVDALLALAEKVVEALIRKERRKTKSADSGT